MTTSHSSAAVPDPAVPDEAMTVVIDPGRPPYDTPVLELGGPLDSTRLEAALDLITAEHPQTPAWHPRTRRRRGRQTLRTPRAYPVGLLADLLTCRTPRILPVRSFPATPLQRELLADADAHPGTGRGIGQLTWAWYGPFDQERFADAWQSVADRESVLRAGFDNAPEPRILIPDRVVPELDRLPQGSEPWHALVERDRRRGVDPRRPGPLRITVIGGAADAPAGTSATRVLLTYHHALLDDWSVHLLLREFYRAYLAGGRLAGGERRPDIEDYARWLAGQDTVPARDFWSRALPPGTGPQPAPPEDTAERTPATGRVRLPLTRAQTARLRTWAATWGAAESTVLQAVWALLLHRASGAGGPARVRFDITVTGRGIPLDGAQRLPGALRGALPVSVEVDPDAAFPALLAQLVDKALDMSGYEWVSAGQVRDWSGEATDPAESLLVFEGRPPALGDLAAECAAQGISAGEPEHLAARTAFPTTLVAHHDGDDRLVLTVTYDRARPAEVAEALTQTALLLGILLQQTDGYTTLGEVLDQLSAALESLGGAVAPVLPATDPLPEPGPEPGLVTLRPAARPDAGTVCLLQTHDVPRARYDRLARRYPGPEAIVLLRLVPEGTRARYTALRPLADGRLVLGAFSGGGAAAHELTRLIAADGGRPPLVVLTGAAGDGALLTRLLEAVAAQAG
ncbi:condensation domain-containing protein [Kitasatospora sp. NPDC006697]|uniref:condensation domain-containing protein n=1 Tax=Kitasatospora sp. NPDC006697 TaxID=3364020 RepID=UPI00369B01C1